MGVKKKYLVLTADIVESRSHKLGEGIDNALSWLNERFADVIMTHLDLYRGDEIQGVLKKPEKIAALIRLLRFSLYPLTLRMGIGMGGIERGLNEEYSWKMDGSSFHSARQALEALKREKGQATFFVYENEPVESLNVVHLLIDAIEKGWTEKQWVAVETYERLGTFDLAGEELNISPQSVHRRCQAARWKEIFLAEEYVNKVIKEKV